MDTKILSFSFRNIFENAEQLYVLSQYSKNEISIINNFINDDPSVLGMGHQLADIAANKFGKDKKLKQKIQQIHSLNKNHAFIMRSYPGLLGFLFKIDPNAAISHILEENAPSQSTLLSILINYDLPENVGKKIRNEVSNLITQILSQPVSLPNIIDKQFLNFIQTYSKTIRDIFSHFNNDLNNPKIILLKQQYIPEQDSKSIIQLKELSLDPQNILESVKFRNQEDKGNVLNASKVGDNYSEFFINRFLPAFRPAANDKTYIYDLYIWGYYNQEQFYSVVNSKKLNREQIIQSIQNQTLEWMQKNLEVPAEHIKIYKKGPFTEIDNGENEEDYLKIKNLNTSLDLIMESNTLNHCAGAYHQAEVENGKEIFYSVQDINNRPKATIVIINQNGTYVVSEIRGHNNSRPDDRYMKFIGEWLRQNNIQESSRSDFQTPYAITDEQKIYNQLIMAVTNNLNKELFKYIKSGYTSPTQNAQAFWNFVFESFNIRGTNFSSPLHDLIFEKYITPENEPTLFNLLVYGSSDGKPNNDYKELQSYILEKFDEYYIRKYDVRQLGKNNDRIPIEEDRNKLLQAIPSYVPIFFNEGLEWADEGAGDLYDTIFEEEIEEQYVEPDEGDYLENRRSEYQEWIEEENEENEEDFDYDPDYELYEEWIEDFQTYIQDDKSNWVEENFPTSSFKFPSNVMLILKGVIRPGNQHFDDLFNKLKELPLIHNQIKNWVLKGSAISRNKSYAPYYYDLAQHWIQEKKPDHPMVDHFGTQNFAALAVHTKSISRLDGMEMLKLFLEKMSPDELKWGYEDYDIKDVTRNGVISRLDYPSDKDAKLDFILNIRKNTPLQAYDKKLIDNDTKNDVFKMLIPEIEETHEKYKDQNLYDTYGRKKSYVQNFYISVQDIFMSLISNLTSSNYKDPENQESLQMALKFANIIAEGKEPSELLEVGKFAPEFNQSKILAMENMIENKDYLQIHIALAGKPQFDYLLQRFPELHSKMFYTLLNGLKENPKILNTSLPQADRMLLQNSSYTNYLDDVVDFYMEKGNYKSILLEDKLPPHGDPRRQIIIQNSINELGQQDKFSILKNRTIDKQDGQYYYDLLSDFLKKGALPELIFSKVLEPETEVINWIINTPEFWENIGNTNHNEFLSKTIINMNEKWEPLREKLIDIFFEYKSPHHSNSFFLHDEERLQQIINNTSLGQKMVESGYGFQLLERQLIDPQNEQLVNDALNSVVNSEKMNNVVISTKLLKTFAPTLYGKNFYEKLINLIMSENPDLILSGDILFLFNHGHAEPGTKLYEYLINLRNFRLYWNFLKPRLNHEIMTELQKHIDKQKNEPQTMQPNQKEQNQEEINQEQQNQNEQTQEQTSIALINLYKNASFVVSTTLNAN